MSYVVKCRIHRGPIDNTHRIYRYVHGYVRERDAGGPNQLTLREETGEYACEECIRKLRRGEDPNQPSLL